MRLMVATTGSNCISWASVACLKRSQAIPMHGCRDMVCDRYTQKYMQNTSTYIKD